MKMITILLLGLIVGILLVGSGCCEREPDVQNVTTQDKSKIDDFKIPQREIVDRTYTTDTYDNKDGTFTQTNYMGAVNIWWWDEFIPVEDYLNPVVKGDSLTFNDPNGNKIIEFEMNYEKESVLSLASPKIEVNSFRGGYYFETDADTEVKSMEYDLSSDFVDEFEFRDNKVWVNNIPVDFGMAKDLQNITTTFDKVNSKLVFEIEEGKTGSLERIDPSVTYNFSDQTRIDAREGEQCSNDPTVSGENPGCTNGDIYNLTTDSALDLSDNSREESSGDDWGYDHAWIRFWADTSDIDFNSIISINWTWEGRVGNGGDVLYIHYYDFLTDDWSISECDSTSSTSDVWLSCYSTTDLNKYINSVTSETYFLAYIGTLDYEMETDYAVLTIEYTPKTPALNLTYPTSSATASASALDVIQLWFNLTDGDGALIISGATPFNITIDSDEAVLQTHEFTSDLLKYRSDNDFSTKSNNPETFTHGSFDNSSYAALCTGSNDTSVGYFSCEWSSKGIGSVAYSLDLNNGASLAQDYINVINIPYGDYELNATSHLECSNTTSGTSWTPTFTTEFPDANYAVFCNPATDDDAAMCISYNTGSEKTTTTMNVRSFDDSGAAETVSSVDWCAISYGVWNLSRIDGDDVMIQAGRTAIASWATNMEINLYEAMPSNDYVVITTHEDNDVTDVAACQIRHTTTTSFITACYDDDSGSGAAGEYVYWVAISLDGDTNLTKTETVDDFGLADPTLINCTGTLDCSGYATETSCINCSECSWGVGSPVSDTEDFSSSSDYDPYQGLNSGWFYETADTTRCINDANDDCICYDENTADSDTIEKQSDIDMSGCDSGTGNVTFTKLWEGGALEPTDCLYAYFSDDNGATWGDKTEIACDDPAFLADPTTIAIPDAYLVSGFRLQLEGSNIAGTGETMCADGIVIACSASIGCSNDGACSTCDIDECITNCSTGGCEYGYSYHNWTANVTVPPGCSGSSDLFVDVLYSSAHVNSTETGAITCAAADTCTYSGSGDWEIDCTDNCEVDSEQKVDGDVNVYGSSGSFTLNDIITFIGSNQYLRILEAGCEIIINSGGGAGGPTTP